MAFDWSSIFDHYGIKRVTETDKAKGAYVPNAQQQAALAAAGLTASSGGGTGVTHPIEVLFDPQTSLIQTSYYKSVRAGSGRTPEPRMGQGLIRWANVGDVIVLGNIGSRVLAARQNVTLPAVAETGRELSKKIDPKRIYENAKRATGKPDRKNRTVSDFVRNPHIVAAAILRSAGACEMPGCTTPLFKRDDGTTFLEVHHITPLAENGDDTLANAAALCPMCHRELHFGARRRARRLTLAAHVASIVIP